MASTEILCFELNAVAMAKLRISNLHNSLLF